MDAIVIGAGPAGLALAASLKAEGLKPVILERADAVASAWRGHYDSLHLHTARGRSGLPGRPMPREYPEFPSRDQVVAYLDGYAKAEKLEIRFGAEVTEIAEAGSSWRVRYAGGSEAAPVVVLATGLNGTPRLPHWPGMGDFPGPVLHSHDYQRAGIFTGQRVLVVGFGNSGGDIALDLAGAGAHPAVAVRGAVTIMPLKLFGIPTTSLGLLPRLLGPQLADRLTAAALRAVIGRAEDYGLRPSDKGPATLVVEDGRVPLIDHGALRAVREGRIAVRPGIGRFEDGAVVFTDGTWEVFDAVILATGYEVDLRPLLGARTDVLDGEGHPLVCGGPSAARGLYFCSYRASPLGQLSQMGIEARAIARNAAASRTA